MFAGGRAKPENVLSDAKAKAKALAQWQRAAWHVPVPMSGFCCPQLKSRKVAGGREEPWTSEWLSTGLRAPMT